MALGRRELVYKQLYFNKHLDKTIALRQDYVRKLGLSQGKHEILDRVIPSGSEMYILFATHKRTAFSKGLFSKENIFTVKHVLSSPLELEKSGHIRQVTS